MSSAPSRLIFNQQVHQFSHIRPVISKLKTPTGLPSISLPPHLYPSLCSLRDYPEKELCALLYLLTQSRFYSWAWHWGSYPSLITLLLKSHLFCLLPSRPHRGHCTFLKVPPRSLGPLYTCTCDSLFPECLFPNFLNWWYHLSQLKCLCPSNFSLNFH